MVPVFAYLPILRLFKSPCRYIVLAHLGLAILAAVFLATQNAERDGRQGRMDLPHEGRGGAPDHGEKHHFPAAVGGQEQDHNQGTGAPNRYKNGPERPEQPESS